MSKYNLTDLISENKMQLTEGTRAMVAYLDGDKLITTYNHYDGYPENLGKGLEAHYNDDAKAKEIANKGYITYLDPETGDIEATHNDPAREIKLPSEDEDMARVIAGEIDNMFANYGYIWDDRADKWIVINNTGIRSMIDQIMKEMGDYNMDENKENVSEVTMANVNVDEVKFHLDAYEAGTIDGDDLHQAISEIFFGKVVAPGMNSDDDFEREQRMQLSMREDESIEESDNPEVDALLDKIRKHLKGSDRNFQDGEIEMYIDSLNRDIKRGDFDGVESISMEDHEEDLENYIADKALQEHFGRFMK